MSSTRNRTRPITITRKPGFSGRQIAIQTPAILQRAGLRHRIGRTLAVHPTVKLAARFDDCVNTPEDVSVYQVKQFAPNISFGGSASHPGLVGGRQPTHYRYAARRLRECPLQLQQRAAVAGLWRI